MVALIGTEDTNFLIDETNKSWIKCEETKKRGGETERKYTVLPMELSRYIKENLNYIFVRGAAVEMPLMYVYTNGYYKLVSDNPHMGSVVPVQMSHPATTLHSSL